MLKIWKKWNRVNQKLYSQKWKYRKSNCLNNNINNSTLTKLNNEVLLLIEKILIENLNDVNLNLKYTK